MSPTDREWASYVDDEVREVCALKGWRHQIRRRRSAREKPVDESPVDDYEWKLVVKKDESPDPGADDFEGVYYVLSFDRTKDRFILQHDCEHCGRWGPHWEVATYSEIRPNRMGEMLERRDDSQEGFDVPPEGWLRDHLLTLISRFQPNTFSYT